MRCRPSFTRECSIFTLDWFLEMDGLGARCRQGDVEGRNRTSLAFLLARAPDPSPIPPLAWGNEPPGLHRNATPYHTYAQRALSTNIISPFTKNNVKRQFTPSEKVTDIVTVAFSAKP